MTRRTVPTEIHGRTVVAAVMVPAGHVVVTSRDDTDGRRLWHVTLLTTNLDGDPVTDTGHWALSYPESLILLASRCATMGVTLRPSECAPGERVS